MLVSSWEAWGAGGGTRHSPTLLPCRTSPQPPRCPRIVLWYRGSRSLEQPSRRRHVPGPRCLATARHNPGNRRPVSAKACVSTASAPRPREPGRSGPGQCQPAASPPAPLRPPLACPAPEHMGPRPEGPPVGPASRGQEGRPPGCSRLGAHARLCHHCFGQHDGSLQTVKCPCPCPLPGHRGSQR